ncbi:zf-HC2 domain-containing protein [Roseococcus sp. DSY-14]
MPTCQEVALRLSDHLDRALPLRRSLGVQAHLALCPNCRRYAAQLRETLGLARAAGQAAPADEAGEAAALAMFDRLAKKGA